ncbi:hypothetical protein PR202_gb03803 [Eleusine coracana subsp. coracana]|uniref:Uncharacterized protein n=1 Tax=Eleusine coracana subsp. coracana TaxID=191504 RepID=A0AAV5E2V6_ELECO|nr:hypothetical protein PR202_gb03803 [Eleusine coracana subsp. coracana]
MGRRVNPSMETERKRYPNDWPCTWMPSLLNPGFPVFLSFPFLPGNRRRRGRQTVHAPGPLHRHGSLKTAEDHGTRRTHQRSFHSTVDSRCISARLFQLPPRIPIQPHPSSCRWSSSEGNRERRGLQPLGQGRADVVIASAATGHLKDTLPPRPQKEFPSEAKVVDLEMRFSREELVGSAFIAFGVTLFAGFFYAAIVSKLLPPYENQFLAAVQNDW